MGNCMCLVSCISGSTLIRLRSLSSSGRCRCRISGFAEVLVFYLRNEVLQLVSDPNVVESLMCQADW